MPTWEIDKKYPVKYTVNDTNKSITVTWLKSYTGEFEIQCNGYTKTVIVESLY